MESQRLVPTSRPRCTPTADAGTVRHAPLSLHVGQLTCSIHLDQREFKKICDAKDWLARNIGSVPVPAPGVWAPTPRMNHEQTFIDLKWIHPPLHVKLAAKAVVWLLVLAIAGQDYYKKRTTPERAGRRGRGDTGAAQVNSPSAPPAAVG